MQKEKFNKPIANESKYLRLIILIPLPYMFLPMQYLIKIQYIFIYLNIYLVRVFSKEILQ